MNNPTDALYLLTTALQPTRQAWQQAARFALVESGLSASLAAPVLMVSRLGDGVLQREIAENLGVHPAALVRTLDQAEQAQLLQRRAVPGNRRMKGIYLLPEGKRLAAEMEHSLVGLRKTLFEDIPQIDIDTANRVLKALESRARLYIDTQRSLGK